jgi:hypothetical protein
MDPDVTLERIRVGVAAALSGTLTSPELASNSEGLAEDFQALDDWLTNKKGFPPSDWRK